jgi:3-methyladenine DNA glycosylase Mpg
MHGGARRAMDKMNRSGQNFAMTNGKNQSSYGLNITPAKTGANWFRTNESLTNIAAAETKMNSSYYANTVGIKGGASPLNGGRMTASTFR